MTRYESAKEIYAKYGVDTDAAANKDKCLPLMDNGHYHPTEVVSDKIPALLCFFPEVALHVTRDIRWDSDHVVVLDDEIEKYENEVLLKRV